MKTLSIRWTDGDSTSVRCDFYRIEGQFLVTGSRGGASMGGEYGHHSWVISNMLDFQWE